MPRDNKAQRLAWLPPGIFVGGLIMAVFYLAGYSNRVSNHAAYLQTQLDYADGLIATVTYERDALYLEAEWLKARAPEVIYEPCPEPPKKKRHDKGHPTPVFSRESQFVGNQ